MLVVLNKPEALRNKSKAFKKGHRIVFKQGNEHYDYLDCPETDVV